MTAPFLEVQDLRVDRHGRRVLDVPHLALPEGEALGIIGPNGAGKSSLLQALALLLPVSMRLQIGGRAVRLPQEALALRRQMAVVFQEPLLLDGSVLDNVALGLRLRQVSAAVARERADHWLGRMGVAHLAHRPAHALSGGEAQRVSLARALALQPRILFLDEPFSGLDVLTRAPLIRELRSILRAERITALFVTHDFTELPVLCDRVAVLFAGRIVQSGTPQQVFAHPADDRVAALAQAAAGLLGPLLHGSRPASALSSPKSEEA